MFPGVGREAPPRPSDDVDLPTTPTPLGRIVALDLARGLGVLAMVAGHTLDALLSPEARARPLVAEYWKARGFTAPLFVLVAGWALALSIERGGARGAAVLRARLPRVGLLLALGCGLRFPGWDLDGLLAGAREPWAHLLAFDVLHAIAAGILVTSLVLAAPLSRRERGLLLLAVAVLAVALGLRAPVPPAGGGLLGLAVTQVLGGSSPFPLAPWLAYFCCGAAAHLLAGGRRALLAALGAALVAATCWQGVGTMPAEHPVLVVYRVGAVLLLLGLLDRAPARAGRALAPVGRLSLAVYVLHLPIVYGWSTYEGLSRRIGPSLEPGAALLAAAAVAAGSLAAARALTLAWAWLRARERVPAAVAPAKQA